MTKYVIDKMGNDFFKRTETRPDYFYNFAYTFDTEKERDKKVVLSDEAIKILVRDNFVDDETKQ